MKKIWEYFQIIVTWDWGINEFYITQNILQLSYLSASFYSRSVLFVNILSVDDDGTAFCDLKKIVQTALLLFRGTWCLSSSVTVIATLTVFVLLGSITSLTAQIRSSLTPIFLQAAKKLSTFLLHLVEESFGTAGEGTCMEDTDLGDTWLAIWHRTTPSVSELGRSSPRETFNLVSIWCLRWCMCESCTAALSASRLTVKFILGLAW